MNGMIWGATLLRLHYFWAFMLPGMGGGLILIFAQMTVHILGVDTRRSVADDISCGGDDISRSPALFPLQARVASRAYGSCNASFPLLASVALKCLYRLHRVALPFCHRSFHSLPSPPSHHDIYWSRMQCRFDDTTAAAARMTGELDLFLLMTLTWWHYIIIIGDC